MDWRVPLSDIDFGEEEELAVQQVIRSRWLSMGQVTQNFEREFSTFIGTKHAIAVTNATAALHLACVAVGLKPKDEVILPSLTFVATANAVRYTGATPIFADVESFDWLTISPSAIQRCLTDKTRAIVVMHYGGFPCDMPAILEIARKYELAVIEDSAHAIGSELVGRKLGTWGQIGCFSFFSNKNMTTGEGGMLTTDDDILADRLRLLRSHGMTSLSWDRYRGYGWSYDVVDLGFNYRIDEIRSALGRVQLKKLPANNERRRTLTDLYREYLNERVPEVSLPFSDERGGCYASCHHILPIILPAGTDRFYFMEKMKARGIQTSIHYPAVHQFQSFENTARWIRHLLPFTEAVAAREITLPLYAGMQPEQVKYVVESIQNVMQMGA